MDMTQTDQYTSAEERDDIGAFASIKNGMREIVENLMAVMAMTCRGATRGRFPCWAVPGMTC
jgi:hypothetical protein